MSCRRFAAGVLDYTAVVSESSRNYSVLPSNGERSNKQGYSKSRDHCIMTSRRRDPYQYPDSVFDNCLLLSEMVTTSHHHVTSPRRSTRPSDENEAPYVLIDSRRALSHLSEIVHHLCSAGECCVGVGAEGVLLGRAGRLCLLCLCAGRLIVLVDMVLCDAGAAVSVLRPLLESQRVVKTMHDCRLLCDLLWHQFAVKLSRVFDTQAADVSLQHALTGVTPEFVVGLPHTLVSYLRLPHTQVFFPRYRSEQLATDQQVWLRRPLCATLINAAICNVRHLCRLRQFMLSRLPYPLTRCVATYMAAVRDANCENAALAPFERHRVPVEIRDILDNNSNNINKQQQRRRESFNVVATLDPGFQYTRNVWH